MTAPPTLPEPLVIAQVSTLGDRFRCPPYNVVMFAGACVKRQAVLRADPTRAGFSQCQGCAHGAAIEQQTGGPIEVESMSPGRRWSNAYYAGIPAKRRLPVVNEPSETPPPAPPAEEPAMPKCTHEGCGAVVRAGKFKEPPPAGTETLCAGHRAEVLGRTDEVSRKLIRQRERRMKAAGSKPSAPKPTPPQPTRVEPQHQPAPAGDATRMAHALVEAHSLVTAIGWELARDLARAVTGRNHP